jgi:glycosyltransferase involved in cell wall biosynthesis
MSKKIKVCFYMTTILEHWGGLEKYYIDTANKLNESEDLEVDIVTLDDDFSLNFIKILSLYNFKKIEKSILYKEPTSEIYKKLVNTKYLKCKNFSELKRTFNNYDIIYSKNELLEAFIIKFFIGFKRIPKVIFGCHTSLSYPNATNFRQHFRNFLYGSFIYKFLAKDIFALHTINSFDTNFAKNLFPNKPVFKIYNPFNFNKFKINSKKNYFNFPSNKTNILWIGTLTPLKGTSDLFDIISTVNSKKEYEEKINWIIAGIGPDQKIVTNLLSKFNNINYLGFVDYEKVPSLINKSDLIISTSKVETFSFITIEANTLDKPVFSYRTSGQTDIIENNVNGILINDLREYPGQIIKYVDKCYNFKDISSFISKKFDEKNIYSNLELMFKSVNKQNGK